MLNADGSPSLDAIRALFDAQTGHATPKIDVRGVVFQDDKILLVQEKLDNFRWTLPGGWADVGESAGEAVAREIFEESGYATRAVKLLALLDRNKHDHPPYPFHAYKAFFRCELTDPERHVDPALTSASFGETGEVGWFADDALPELSVGRVTQAQIARFFEHLRQPDLPTDFD
ncbi:MAG: NUDIX domain-containing protein [Anaerolineae bacterium]